MYLGEVYINLSKTDCKGLFANLNIEIEIESVLSFKLLALYLEFGTSSGVLGPFVSTWW